MARVFEGKERRNLAILLLLCVAGVFFAFWKLDRPQSMRLGVTFSTVHARELGLDPRETFDALLGDLGVRRFRIPVYWTEIQPSPDEYYWDDLDAIMREADARGTEVTLAIGMKVPRWPECFVPDWAKGDAGQVDEEALSAYLRAVVERYRSSPALSRWQVENEPFFSFGVCPQADPSRVEREVKLVRSLDSHPIALTASGEWEAWRPTARLADALGISLYRSSWNPVIGYIHYPIPAWAYCLRAWLIRPVVGTVFISELQAEPWRPGQVSDHTPEEWERFFSPEDLRANVEYASHTGLQDADLWGAEWWYWMKQHGRSGLWEEARRLFADR